jgi:Zn finger protein HypA/HybF involved in hydrogenase expression
MGGLDKVATIPLEKLLDNNTNIKGSYLKTKLIANGLKVDKCEVCGLDGKELTLELHHINGNHFDNRIENLQILCPNCHSKTPNYRRKNKIYKKNLKDFKDLSEFKTKKDAIESTCMYCGKTFTKNYHKIKRKFCSRECYSSYLKINGNFGSGKTEPSVNLEKDYIISQMCNFKDLTNFSKHLGISTTTLRKVLNKYDLLEEFKSKYEFKAKAIIQYDMNMNFIKEWPSITDAEETLGITSISKVLNLKRRSAGGFIWRFKKD